MTDSLALAPVAHAAGTVALPGSKSISNRTLLLAALATGTTRVRGLLDADDVERMLEALATLGVRIDRKPSRPEVVVHGTGGAIPARRASLFLGNAGTAFRPLTAALAFAHGDYELAGVPRMHERPIGDLVDALRALGADIRYLGSEGYPPLAIGPGAISDAAIPRTRQRARRRVEPVPVRAADGVADADRAAPRRAIAVDIVGDLDFETLRRHHREPDGALRRRGGAATTGAHFAFPPARATRRPGRSTSKAMPRPRRISSPRALSAADRCA